MSCLCFSRKFNSVHIQIKLFRSLFANHSDSGPGHGIACGTLVLCTLFSNGRDASSSGVWMVYEFVDQSLGVIDLPSLTHISSLENECSHGGHIFACAKVWWSSVTRLRAMPNDCPKFRPVILGFIWDALVLQGKLIMLYISCYQETTEFLSWRAWL